jgi:peroxiredoxin
MEFIFPDMTRRPLILLAAAASLLAAVPASAALKQGDRVPSLVTQGALAGKPFAFNLQQELRKGPVVLYFFPKAFTPGCSLEAKAFAENIDEFKKAGAQVFGMSGDTLEDLEKFSVKECAGAFPVARATPSTIEAFDVTLSMNGQKNANLSDRTSYVIAPDGKIVMVHSDLDWSEHVNSTLAAVKALKAG